MSSKNQDLIAAVVTGAISGLANVIKISREALASDLEEIAKKVRNGDLIPESLVERVEKDSNRIEDIRNRLK